MKIISFTLFLVVHIISSSVLFAQDNTKTIIKGKSNFPEGTLIVLNELEENQLFLLDSARTDKKGAFTLSCSPTELTLGFITFKNNKPPGISVAIPVNKTLNLDVKDESPYSYTISGNENIGLFKLNQVVNLYDEKLKSFNQRIETLDVSAMSDSAKNLVNTEYATLVNERSKTLIEFLDKEDASLATYFGALYLFNKVEPILISKAEKKMTASFPQSKYTEILKKMKASFGPSTIGAEIPEIKIADPDGKIISLSSLRGKVVLIDFWASWCGPCRRENPHVKKLYDQYKEKGFEIFGVSLDSDRQQWINAIAKDQLTWYHGSELKGWNGAISQQFQVKSIPKTILIDEQGVIIQVDLRSPQLAEFLASYFAGK